MSTLISKLILLLIRLQGHFQICLSQSDETWINLIINQYSLAVGKLEFQFDLAKWMLQVCVKATKRVGSAIVKSMNDGSNAFKINNSEQYLMNC